MYPKKRLRYHLILLALLFTVYQSSAKPGCKNTPGRSWWDVQHYELHADFNIEDQSISGYNIITSRVTLDGQSVMEIDLQLPMVIDSVVLPQKDKQLIPFMQEDDLCYIMFPFAGFRTDDTFSVKIFYHGRPRQAINAPWDGGLVSRKDAAGNYWLAMACEGTGGSIWWPCKDLRSDEPDEGVDLYYGCTAGYTAIGNGKLVNKYDSDKDRKVWHWRVQSPINIYNVTFYIGKYDTWRETFKGLSGNLTLDYYVLKGNKARAQKHFAEVKPMLTCFEQWMGPYPFYEDGYKLVEAPYLGMEHQSAVAWGNEYNKGYKGIDRSGTGYGLLFDFLIIHESGHEWFGNSITAASPEDTWIQEGFTSYTETLYLECLAGKEKAFEYQHGKWRNIRNDAPPQGIAGSCDEGSADHYDKAGAMIHMIRAVMGNDSLFRQMLLDMNRRFRHKTVSAAEIETFINEFSGRDFSAMFRQYLTTKDIPRISFRKNADGTVSYKWLQAIDGLDMPVLINVGSGVRWITPSSEWQNFHPEMAGDIRISDIFLVNASWSDSPEG